jgi:pimeloyl-ACP methyl ester carboxylesterase
MKHAKLCGVAHVARSCTRAYRGHDEAAGAHIVGHSMGAGITAKLLTTNPDRFLTATLSGVAGKQNWTTQDAAAAEAEAVELEQGIPFRSSILRTAPPDQPKPTDEMVQARSQQLLARNDPLALAAAVRSRGEQTFSAMQMAAVRTLMPPEPTLLILGSHSLQRPGGGDSSRLYGEFFVG